MSQDWKHGLTTPPKPEDFPIVGKLPTDNQRPPKRCRYFIINEHQNLSFQVGDNDYLWKCIENI